MASLIIIASVLTLTGVLFGAYVTLSFAIRRDDRRGSLRFDATTPSAQTARDLVGISSSRWD
jgi:hypothetical protein